MVIPSTAPEEAPLVPPLSDDPDWEYITSPVTRTSMRVPVECAPHVEIVTYGDGTETDPFEEYITSYDLGPRTYATGTTTFDDRGLPVTYTVAEGDTWTGLSERFCGGGPLVTPERLAGLDLFAGETLEVPTHDEAAR